MNLLLKKASIKTHRIVNNQGMQILIDVHRLSSSLATTAEKSPSTLRNTVSRGENPAVSFITKAKLNQRHQNEAFWEYRSPYHP